MLCARVVMKAYLCHLELLDREELRELEFLSIGAARPRFDTLLLAAEGSTKRFFRQNELAIIACTESDRL